MVLIAVRMYQHAYNAEKPLIIYSCFWLLLPQTVGHVSRFIRFSFKAILFLCPVLVPLPFSLFLFHVSFFGCVCSLLCGIDKKIIIEINNWRSENKGGATKTQLGAEAKVTQNIFVLSNLFSLFLTPFSLGRTGTQENSLIIYIEIYVCNTERQAATTDMGYNSEAAQTLFIWPSWLSSI